ncbi:MAG: TRAP transporter small permease [Deltaproteobacteria bacterium]|nr:TRAP transporter small permease [Deltaproteobacteria bacterium]
MKTIIHKINQLLSGFCGWLMVAMMVLLVIDIISRTMGRPVQGIAELSVFVMMVVIYLGMARCEENREHVRLEIVINALPTPARKFMVLFFHLLASATVGIILYAVAQNAFSSYRTNEALEGTVELRIWPIKFIMVIGLVFFFIQTLINTVDAARSFRKPQTDHPEGAK